MRRLSVCQVDDDAVHGVEEPQGNSPPPASSFEEDGVKVVRQDVERRWLIRCRHTGLRLRRSVSACTNWKCSSGFLK